MIRVALITPHYLLGVNDFTVEGFIGRKRLSWSPLPRLWALSLATYLKEALPNAKTEIIDANLVGQGQLFKKIKREKFDIVGLSPLVISYEHALNVARFAKKYGAKVVLGGHYATALRKEILQNRGPKSKDYCVDTVIQHDGEKAFYEYVSGKPLSKIKNLVYQEKNSQIKENSIEILNLDELPTIDYGLVNLEDYFKWQLPVMRRMVSFVSQRGCAWAEKVGRCFFCSIQDKKLRTRSPKKVWQEINQLVKKYKIRLIYDVCDDFTGSQDWFKEFCRRSSVVKHKPLFKIDMRPSHVNPENVSLLKKLNVKYITLGVESFSDKILLGMRKGLTSKINKNSICLLAKANLVPIANIILGSLDENRETLNETIREIKYFTFSRGKKLGLGFNLFVFRPDPGSPAWLQFLKKEKKYRGRDLINIKEASYDWNKHFCKVGLSEIEYVREKIIETVTRKAKDYNQ